MRRFPVALTLVLALSACGSPSREIGERADLECVPFARALSGIYLRGDAPDWWWEADGRYARGKSPQTGAVMVFAPNSVLPRGHVSVVSRVISRREISVTQANWVRRRVTTDQLAVDISPFNDWSRVRVWWPPSNVMGSTVYPVFGFIYSGFSTSHDQLVRAVPGAIRVAMNE
jgi:surface antigen